MIRYRAGIFMALVLGSRFALSASAWSTSEEQACRQDTAGHFKFYTLTLSWSPEFCRSHPDQKREPQCTEHREFIVHGLWPECENGNPERCRNGGVADAIDRDRTFAFMPSDFLIKHEWEKHGTCSGLNRSEYFALTGEFFGKIKLPRLSGSPGPDKIESLFMENNPGLGADEIYLSCTETGAKSSPKTLDEVRICFDRTRHEFTRCDSARDTCRKLKKVEITPAK